MNGKYKAFCRIPCGGESATTLLYTPDLKPISEVDEIDTPENLALSLPR